jgi:hypothetical protein
VGFERKQKRKSMVSILCFSQLTEKEMNQREEERNRVPAGKWRETEREREF